MVKQGWGATAFVAAWMVGGLWVAACGDDGAETPASSLPDAAPLEAAPSSTTEPLQPVIDAAADAEPPSDAATTADADADADADAGALPVLRRVSGNVDLGGPVVGAAVEVLSPTPASTTTDNDGDFFFFAPIGSTAIVKVTPAPDAGSGAMPMIRGLVVGDTNRIRVFYLAGDAERGAAASVGTPLDPAKAVVAVDFRNAQTGGYGVVLKDGNTTVTPPFGVVLDETDTPRSSLTTLAGGNGSTLYLGDLGPANLSFSAVLPADAGLPCTPCDAPVLPLQPGVVTWFDFECGTATDCK